MTDTEIISSQLTQPVTPGHSKTFEAITSSILLANPEPITHTLSSDWLLDHNHYDKKQYVRSIDCAFVDCYEILPINSYNRRDATILNTEFVCSRCRRNFIVPGELLLEMLIADIPYLRLAYKAEHEEEEKSSYRPISQDVESIPATPEDTLFEAAEVLETPILPPIEKLSRLNCFFTSDSNIRTAHVYLDSKKYEIRFRPWYGKDHFHKRLSDLFPGQLFLLHVDGKLLSPNPDTPCEDLPNNVRIVACSVGMTTPTKKRKREEESVNVLVRHKSKYHYIPFKEDDTVRDFKRTLASYVTVPVDRMVLFSGDTILDDVKRMCDYSVTNTTNLLLHVKEEPKVIENNVIMIED